MEFSNPQTMDHIIEANGETLRLILIPIGDWDMDTVPAVNIAHGMNVLDIRPPVSLLIRDDNGTMLHPSAGVGVVNGIRDVWINEITNTDIFLARRTGSWLDAIPYSTTPFNRGWVLVTYVE